MVSLRPDIITVALNPAIDRGIEVHDFKIGKHQPCKTIFRRPAGKAVNVARVLDMLNTPSILIGFVGKGQQKYFESIFQKDKVVTPQLFAVESQTRENITIVDPVNNIETHLRDQSFKVKPQDIEKLKKKLDLLARKGSIVAFCGSLPEEMKIDNFIELVNICQEKGSKVCVDSSGWVLKAVKSLGLWLIKPNKEELSEMLGIELPTYKSIIENTDKLLEFIEIAIITAGSGGAYLITKELKLHGYIPIDQTMVKNTVGCGDALLAGFLSAYIKGQELVSCFKFSLAVATASALSLTPAEVELSTAEKLIEKSIITTIHQADTKELT